jgi:transposase-like protein
MARQGCSLSEQEVKRIVMFLANTDMTISEIAQRMTCSRATIATINRKFQVRKYAAPKSRWILVYK